MKSYIIRLWADLKRRLFGKLRWEIDGNSYRWVVIVDDQQMFVVKCFEIDPRWDDPEAASGQFVRDLAGGLTIDHIATTQELRGRDLGTTILAIGHMRNGGQLPDPKHELPGSENFWKNWRSPAGRKKIEKLTATVQSRTRLDI